MALSAVGVASLAGATVYPVLEWEAWIIGEDQYDSLGWAVSSSGDVNGDGFDDLLVGADGNSEGNPAAGQAYLFLGGGWIDEIDATDADASFLGQTSGEWLGAGLAVVADVDGDGLDEVLLGASGYMDVFDDVGKVYLFLGRTSGWALDTPATSADASFVGTAQSARAAGDVDGDGYDDLLVGAPSSINDPGQTYLIFGQAGGWGLDVSLSSADVIFTGEAAGDFAGYDIAGGGDLDGDGFDDILIGAPQYNSLSGPGKIYVILGKSSGWSQGTSLSSADASFIGEAGGDEAGSAVAIAGDVNGDGLDDILIGAYENDEADPDAGQVYLLLGRESGWTWNASLSAADASFWGELGNDEFGYDVAGPGDVDGDGYDDLLVGADGRDDNGENSGAVYLIFGRVTGWGMDTLLSDTDASILGDPNDRLGKSVAGGDINGDGYADLVSGAPYHSPGGYVVGRTVLVLGFPNTDSDGDGWWTWDNDCDDGNPAVHPGATEVQNGVDDNCDGNVDEGTDAYDDDGDGYTEQDGDCNDADFYVHPGALEFCNGVDDDCDGVLAAFETDGDGDGYLECGDCDDADPGIYPGAPEICGDGVDSDCGDDLEETELDGDGDGISECEGDCDDHAPDVYPGAEETCNNGVDDDCDDTTDEFVDGDGDGYSVCDGDCDDSDAGIHPGAEETCDGFDEDCNGLADDLDADEDGFYACEDDCDDGNADVYPGAPEEPYNGVDEDCDGLDLTDVDGDGYDGGAEGDDCDDEDSSIHPGADEVPHNSIDEDCDGDDLTDMDGDGFHGGADGNDCNDLDAEIHLGAEEICDDWLDNDCDDLVDGADNDCFENDDSGDGGEGCSCSSVRGAIPGGEMLALLFLLVGLLWTRRSR